MHCISVFIVKESFVRLARQLQRNVKSAKTACATSVGISQSAKVAMKMPVHNACLQGTAVVQCVVMNAYHFFNVMFKIAPLNTVRPATMAVIAMWSTAKSVEKPFVLSVA